MKGDLMCTREGKVENDDKNKEKREKEKNKKKENERRSKKSREGEAAVTRNDLASGATCEASDQ